MNKPVIILLLLLTRSIVGFTQTETPSLQQGEKFFQSKEYDSAYQEFEKAYRFFKENGKTEEMLEALFQMGKSNTHQAKWEESLSVFELLENEAKNIKHTQMVGRALNAQIQILDYFKRDKESERKAKELLAINGLSGEYYSDAYTVLGHIYSTEGKLEEGYDNFLRAYQIDSLSKDSTSLPFLLAGMAGNLALQGKYNESVRIYLQAIATTPAHDSFKLSTFYSRLGNLFLDLGNFDKAEFYLTDALRISKKHKHKGTAAKCTYFLGNLYADIGNFKKTNDYYEDALKQFRELNNPEFEFYTLNGLARSFLHNNNLAEAEKYLRESESYLQRLPGETFKRSHINNQLEYNLKSNNLPAAGNYLKSALQDINDFQKIAYQIRTYQLANQYYLQQGDYKNAYYYKDKYQILKDSVFQIQKANLIYDMEAKYKKAEQDLSIANLNMENNKKSILLERKNRTIVFGSLGILVLSALGFMGFYLYRIKRKTAEELAAKNNIISKALADKELLLREIHHRVKNNLQVISSLLRLQSKYIKDDNALSALNEGRNRVQSMALIHQNLYQEDNLMGIQIQDYFEKLIQSLFDSYKISESRIALKMEIEPLTLDVDTVVPLGLIVNELVSNTFKHAFPENREGNICINLKETKDHQLQLTISDDGIGMNEIAIDTNKDSFGYKMIRAFQDKLEAKMEVTSKNTADSGTTVRLLIGDFKKIA